MNYKLNQEVEAYTASGWQKGKIVDVLNKSYSVEKQNGHIGVYDVSDIRPAHVDDAEKDDCPIRKRMQQGQQEADPIRPNHYTRFAIDPIEYCLKNEIGFCAGNVIKYVSRFDMKGGLEDLDKAEEYLRRMRKDYAEKQAKAAQKN